MRVYRTRVFKDLTYAGIEIPWPHPSNLWVRGEGEWKAKAQGLMAKLFEKDA